MPFTTKRKIVKATLTIINGKLIDNIMRNNGKETVQILIKYGRQRRNKHKISYN